MRLTLQRINNKTIGCLYRDEINQNNFLCFTLERPPLNNARDNPKTKENESSRIPAGIYKVKWVKTPKFPDGVFQIQNVENRTGIAIHSANRIDQLKGCIAPGLGTDQNQVFRSKEALQILIGILPEEWELEIVDPY